LPKHRAGDGGLLCSDIKEQIGKVGVCHWGQGQLQLDFRSNAINTLHANPTLSRTARELHRF